MCSYNPEGDYSLTKDANYFQGTQTNNKNLYMYSKSVQEYDEYGYKKYNIPNKSDVFVSKLFRSAISGCSEPIFMIAIQNRFIGYNRVIKKIDKRIDDIPMSSYNIDALFVGVTRGTPSNGMILGFDDFTMSGNKCQKPHPKK